MHLTRELARAERLKSEVSLMVMDLDDFKEINDSHGHHVGDRALREVARVLRAAIRPYDICVRYAGDEFIVVLSGCGADEAEQQAPGAAEEHRRGLLRGAAGQAPAARHQRRRGGLPARRRVVRGAARDRRQPDVPGQGRPQAARRHRVGPRPLDDGRARRSGRAHRRGHPARRGRHPLEHSGVGLEGLGAKAEGFLASTDSGYCRYLVSSLSKPDEATLAVPLRILSNRLATPTSRVLRIALGDVPFSYRAGQAALLLAEGDSEPTPYSLASSPEETSKTGWIEFLVKVDGSTRFGARVSALRRGDRVRLSGPLGSFVFPENPTAGALLFIAGGTGIAPLRSMIRHVLDLGPTGRVHLALFRTDVPRVRLPA